VPADLLRLSVGLESVDDLIADLAHALEGVGPTRTPERKAPRRDGIRDAVITVVEQTVMPLLIARGASVRVASVERDTVVLEVEGSPGAIVPAVDRIRAMVLGAVPGIADVKLTWADASVMQPDATDLAGRVQQILDSEINGAVAAHGGHVALVEAGDGRVRLRLEGGCQGCSLAEVTLRQGIEPILRKHLPEVTAVVDVTDHAAATAPFFAPGKR
jgi:Fe-S cluster biogenesis protein NfuA